MVNHPNKWQTFIYGLLIAAGILIGVYLSPGRQAASIQSGENKISEILNLIKQSYVDTVNIEEVEKKSIEDLLSNLDPHSVYIPAADLKMANEQLEGNFEGIGVEFNILHDTIMIVSALNGGPAQSLGIQSGDRIVQVDTIPVASKGITSDRVFKLLRGKGGTEVDVLIYRPATRQKIKYTITRGTIPIYSVDASFMLNPTTGYIKISRFAEKTHEEFLQAMEALQNKGLQNLVIDLRGNPGGYLGIATKIVDELLSDKKLIVFTKGNNKSRVDYITEKIGVFENGKLAVLIDEGSASASEILSGAVQDWDRGLIIGRRSFGKGLVQEPFDLADGSQVRLTVARYYTPSERCIQKSYAAGTDYEHEIYDRISKGELEDQNKKTEADTTAYFTKIKGRIVHGGGGINPDIFVPLDTTFSSTYLAAISSNGLIVKFAYDYLDKNRSKMKAYQSLEQFHSQFQIASTDINAFYAYAKTNGIADAKPDEIRKSAAFIQLQIKALIARQLWRENGYYYITKENDKAIQSAIRSFSLQP